ncbi:MAG TPA: hypothetical protein VNN07_10880, partial [Candidatus Tectomicrobia bacterium]|nr:hypothetical protein [Candidatus Tectomicrobia bacterium]
AAVPEPHWGRFRAELRARIDARTRRPRWLAPLPLAASAALAVVLGALAVELAPSRPAPDLVVVEEVAVGSDLDLVRRYPVLDHLELLENFEVIDQLDVLASRDG